MNLAELRKKLKRKKPEFRQREAHKRKKLKDKWKRPKGIHNKLRMRFKGKGNSVSIGYGNPTEIRNLHSSGLQPVLVFTLKQLENLNKEKYGAILASTLGIKNRINLLKKADELNIPILNSKNIKDSLKKYEDLLKNKKLLKKQKEEKKKVREEKAKKQPQKEAKEKELTPDEKEKKEEAEKMKILHGEKLQ